MKVYNTKEVIKVLKVNGYVVIRQNGGSHAIWFNAEKNDRFVLPTGHHAKEINRMLWQRIVKEHHIICEF